MGERLGCHFIERGRGEGESARGERDGRAFMAIDGQFHRESNGGKMVALTFHYAGRTMDGRGGFRSGARSALGVQGRACARAVPGVASWARGRRELARLRSRWGRGSVLAQRHGRARLRECRARRRGRRTPVGSGLRRAPASLQRESRGEREER
jgi:hypothetical protein